MKKPKTQSSYQPPANELPPPPSLLDKRYTFRFSAIGDDKNALIKAALERAGREIESGDPNAAFEFIMDQYIQATEPSRICTSCDGTGDIHRADGEWLGICNCEAGEALRKRCNDGTNNALEQIASLPHSVCRVSTGRTKSGEINTSNVPKHGPPS